VGVSSPPASTGPWQAERRKTPPVMTMVSRTRSTLENLAKSEVQRDLARVYSMVGRVEEAKRLWQEQIRRRPDSFQAHLELGKLYARSGQRRSALREYRLLRQLASRQSTARDTPRPAGGDTSARRCIVRAFQQQSMDAAKGVSELRELIAG
jgi:DNA-binding SARP family transcriptional activator